MVIRGKARGNGSQLAGYLLTQADNDTVRVFDVRGTCQPDSLKASLLEMSLTSELTKSDKGLYHAQINPAYGEDKKMTESDWFHAVDVLEKELKLTEQKRVIIFHEKKDRIHAHVVWERYDHDKEIMRSDSYSRLAQDRARKTIEKELEQKETPHRNIHRPEMKKLLTQLWQKTFTGAEFIKECFNKGYIIAKGELRRPFMVVDETGRSFDLPRQLEGVKTKDVKERLKNEKLKTDKQVIQEIRFKQKEENFNRVQGIAFDKIAKQKEKKLAEEEKKQFFKEKLSDFKTNCVQVVVDPQAQALANLKERERQMNEIVNQKREEQQKASREEQKARLLQQLEEMRRRQSQNKEMGLGL